MKSLKILQKSLTRQNTHPGPGGQTSPLSVLRELDPLLLLLVPHVPVTVDGRGGLEAVGLDLSEGETLSNPGKVQTPAVGERLVQRVPQPEIGRVQQSRD